MAKKTSFKGGLDLNFFAQHEFEAIDEENPERQPLILARNALRLLTMGWPKFWTQFVSWPVVKALFVQRNPVLLRALRLAFQQGFEHLFQQLRSLTLNDEQKEQVQLYLSNCLSLLPYADLTPYESIKIPQLINNQWKLIDYQIKPIELTPRGIKRYFIRDEDRVFAYGLQAIHQKEAHAHLIFMGTTYPKGQGFGPQIDSDFKAFDTVGNTLYQSGRKGIARWIAQQKSEIHVCGVSLGGALSLLCALEHGSRITRVDALNPPGLASTGYYGAFDCWDELPCKPRVVVQKQADDPVSFFGVWKKGWEIVQVTPPKDKQGPNPFCDHFLNYAGFSDTQFSYVCPQEDNKKRIYRNYFVFSLARGWVYYALVVPYIWLLRPLIDKLNEPSQRTSVVFSFAIVVAVFLALILLGFPPVYVLGATLSLGLLNYGPFVFSDFFSLEQNNELLQYAKLHDPQLPRNPELDLYNPDNAINCELSHSELDTYYKVMRCLIKQKEWMPAEDKLFKHNKKHSKKELLIALQHAEHSESPIQLTMTKAKLIHVQRTLDLVRDIGIDHQEQLKHAVTQEYSHYRMGK